MHFDFIDRAGRGWLPLVLAISLAAAAPALAQRVEPSHSPGPDLPRDWSREEIFATLGDEWRTVRTPHVRVHVAHGAEITQRQLRSVEETLARMFGLLAPWFPWRERLSVEPFEYFYSPHREHQRRFVGLATDGVAFPQYGITVARRVPHEHELAHLVVHRIVQPSPPASEPFLQEGLASWLGGDPSRAPTVVLAEADRVLDHTGLDPAVLWTVSRFDAAPLEAAAKYAVAARWVEFLAAEGGIQRVLGLYRLLCGEPDEVSDRPPSSILAQVEGEWGAPWPVLLERFHAWRAANPAGGIRAEPGTVPAREADRVLSADGVSIRIWQQPDGSVLVGAESATGSVDVQLIWGERLGPERVSAAPGGERRRFGLRIDAEGARLRDYREGRLVGRTWWSAQRGGRGRVLSITPELSGRVADPRSAILFVMPRFEVGSGEEPGRND